MFDFYLLFLIGIALASSPGPHFTAGPSAELVQWKHLSAPEEGTTPV